jgi:hypothetical protein
MTDFLTSVKADLLDRRMRPLVAVVAVGLVAAIAYAILGGGSGASSTVPTTSGPSVAASGLAAHQSTTEKAVTEMTGAPSKQGGAAHNPFAPLPQAKVKVTAASPSTGTSSSSASASPSASAPAKSSPSSTGGSTPTPAPSKPTTPSKPVQPAKPKAVYHVAVLFGVLPDSTTPLTPYEDLKLLTPLPSAAQALVIFRGVTAGGKSATFTVVGEVILHGQGACLPSATQCEAIDLQPGAAEQLEYLEPSGQTVVYELKVVSIASANASSAAVKSLLHGESKAGRELLSHDGLEAIPYLHASSQVGVLVFAGHPAFGGHAHAAAHRHHSR